MKKIIPAFLFFCLLPFYVFSQNSNSFSGALIDSTSANKLEYSRILILNSKDSIMISHTKAAADGSFIIRDLPYGKFILLITYPGYADYIEQFGVDSLNKTHNFSRIYLSTKARLLAEVIIRGRSAITVKGDTTEFNAEKFVIQPNSKVEDLLKQLPGIEVDKDGKITAHGQRVNKVLVDSEEFFGDDPTLVTRNIRGDMVDKIQLYDKKSDQAERTGIDDGKKTKTLNVVLKEDSKNGYFGNASAGDASGRLYEEQAMFNAFRTKRKFAAYGNIGTTGKTGLDFTQGNRFGTVPTTVSTVDGRTGFFDELEGTGRYNGRGIPTARTSGAHFDSKWDTDKQSINMNYRIGSIETEGSDNTISQIILPANVTNTATDKTFNNYTFRQKLDVSYQAELNSSSTLKITADGTLKNIRSSNNILSLRTLENGLSLTEQRNILSSTGNQESFNSGLSWNKRFKKQGRSLNLTITHSIGKIGTEGYQNTSNSFYNTSGSTDSIRYIDQRKNIGGNNSGLTTGISYSEALSKTLALYLNYGINVNKSSSTREILKRSGAGNYDILDKEFTNSFDYKGVANLAGATLNFRKQKTLVNLGVRMYRVNYHQLDLYSNKKYDRMYLNWNPQFSYQYSFSQQKSMRLSYSGSTTQPRTDQLQPIKINEDPLNIVSGNPDLKPSHDSRFNATFNSFKPLNSQNISLIGSILFTSSPFAASHATDASGKTIIRTINITNKAASDLSLTGEISRQLKRPSLQVGLNISSGMINAFDVINTILNTKKYMAFSGSLRISGYKLKRYSFSARFNVSYNNSLQSVQDLKDNSMILNSGTSFTLYLLGKTEFNSDVSYSHTTGSQAFGGIINPLIWNSSLSKKFLKSENLKFSVSGNNLLNQNPGFVRRPNYQNIYTTITRYFMGSVTWDFSKMGAKK